MKKRNNKNNIPHFKPNKDSFEYKIDTLPLPIKIIAYFTIQLVLGIIYAFYIKTTTINAVYQSVAWDMSYCFISIGSTRFAFRGLPFMTMVITYTLGQGCGHLIGMIV